MSEQETIILFEKIGDGIREAQRRLFEHKAKLGESVITADAQGQPCGISAEEALRRLKKASKVF